LATGYLNKLTKAGRLTEAELEAVFSQMLSGALSAVQTAAFLIAWRVQGEQATELAAGAQFLRRHSLQPRLPDGGANLADNCGTGGDGLNTFNISTAAAIVAASCGVRIAKHGNRSVSSQCGSADLLFAAGFPDQLSPAQAAAILTETGFTFFFAPNFHPTMRHVMPVRKELGVRTIFNLLGPLANPLQPQVQLIGVSELGFLQPMAEALQQLGLRRGLVVCAEDGLDEISPEVPTQMIELRQGKLQRHVLNPKEYGIDATTSEIVGGDAQINLGILHRFLAGEKSAIMQTVCLNAAALLWLTDHCASIKEGYELALQRVASGEVKKYFARLISVAQNAVKQ